MAARDASARQGLQGETDGAGAIRGEGADGVGLREARVSASDRNLLRVRRQPKVPPPLARAKVKAGMGTPSRISVGWGGSAMDQI